MKKIVLVLMLMVGLASVALKTRPTDVTAPKADITTERLDFEDVRNLPVNGPVKV